MPTPSDVRQYVITRWDTTPVGSYPNLVKPRGSLEITETENGYALKWPDNDGGTCTISPPLIDDKGILRGGISTISDEPSNPKTLPSTFTLQSVTVNTGDVMKVFLTFGEDQEGEGPTGTITAEVNPTTDLNFLTRLRRWLRSLFR